MVCALAGVLGFALTACDGSSSAGGEGGSGGNRGGVPDTVETFMELSDYDCGKSQKCVATYLTEYHDMAVCDGDNGWVIGTLIEKMDCDFSSSSDKSSDSKSNDPAEVTDKSSDSKSNDPAEVTDDSSDSKDSSSSAGTSTKSSNSNTSGNDAKSSSSAGKVESSSSKEKKIVWNYLHPKIDYGEFTDSRDGQVYKTVAIGSQTWMAENLNYAYTGISYNYYGFTFDSTSWCYNNDPANCDTCGRLYTWAAAMDSVGTWSTNGMGCGYGKECSPIYPVRGICPKGWHLPSLSEWDALITAVGDSSTAGRVLKSWMRWYNVFDKGTDVYGFSALPAGHMATGMGAGVDFYSKSYSVYFWSSTEIDGYAYYMYLHYKYSHVNLGKLSKQDGHSVRCVKDSD